MTNAEKARRLHAIASQLELVAYELELSVLSPERERELAARLTSTLDDDVLSRKPQFQFDVEGRLLYSPMIEKLIAAAQTLERDFDSWDEEDRRRAILAVVEALELVDADAKRHES